MPSGIYKLENKITGDFYVGSAVNLHRRSTKHGRTFLQHVYNKYGPENLHKFCMDNKLDHSAIYKVLKGIYHSHKGWTKAQ